MDEESDNSKKEESDTGALFWKSGKVLNAACRPQEELGKKTVILTWSKK